jgi:hypothetical protein
MSPAILNKYTDWRCRNEYHGPHPPYYVTTFPCSTVAILRLSQTRYKLCCNNKHAGPVDIGQGGRTGSTVQQKVDRVTHWRRHSELNSQQRYIAKQSVAILSTLVPIQRLFCFTNCQFVIRLLNKIRVWGSIEGSDAWPRYMTIKTAFEI